MNTEVPCIFFFKTADGTKIIISISSLTVLISAASWPYNMQSLYGGILWVHDIYYDMLRLFSTFSHLPLYFNGLCFFDKYINTNIMFSTPFHCSCFVFVTCYIHLVHFCYTLKVHITWGQVIIYISPSPIYTNPY